MNTPTTPRLTYKGDWTFPVRKDFILDPRYTPGEKALYLALRSFCAPEGDTAFPSSATLAAALGISRDTVFDYAVRLEAKGLLTRRQAKTEIHQFAHSVYTLYPTESPNKPTNTGVRAVSGKSIDGSEPMNIGDCSLSRADHPIDIGVRAVSGKSRTGKNPSREKPVTGNSGPNNNVPLKVNEKPGTQSVADAPAPPLPNKPPPLPNGKPDIRRLTDLWCHWYSKSHADPYVFTAADGVAASRLVKTGISVDRIMAVAIAAWQHPDWFNCKQAAVFRRFASGFNAIADEIAHPPANGHDRELVGPTWKMCP